MSRMSGGATLALGLAAALSACGPVEAPIALDTPEGRPADGLLHDEELQAVVDAQVGRSTAPLVAFLGHERAAVRARAAFALASVQAPEAAPALLALLSDPEAAVRRDAAFALGQTGLVQAGPPLLEALGGEGDASVRRRILEALGKLPSPQVLQGLVALDLPPDDDAHRLLAMARLGAVHGQVSEAAQDALVAKLESPEGAVRHAAAYYFGRDRNTALWEVRAASLRRALDGYQGGDPAAIHLTKALARLGDPADAARLARLAASAPDWRVRAEAMVGLGGADLSAEARGVLLAALDERSIHVAVNAAGALAANPRQPETLDGMAAWVRDHPGRWQVAGPLLVALARQAREDVVLAWVDAVAPDDEALQAVGLRALGALPGQESLRRLRAGAAHASDRVATAALAGLRQHLAAWATEEGAVPAVYFETLSTALSSGRPALAAVAAPVLADPAFGAFDPTRVLLDAMARAEMPADIRIVQAVLSSLGRTGDPAVAAVLREALQHPWADVRRTAARALGQHFGEDVEAPPGGLELSDVARGEAGPDPSTIDWAFLASLGPTPRLVLETEAGALVVRMSSEEAPHTVQTLARLARDGRFDGTPFHRVVPNFVIQGGDVGEGDGRGGPGFAITTEITLIPYRRGVAGMASAGKDTEGSQFFVVHSAQPHLDGGYTAFGWLLDGAEALDGVRQGDLLLSARVEPGG